MKIEYENKFLDILIFNQVHQFLSIPMQLVVFLFAALIFWTGIRSGTFWIGSLYAAFISYLAIWAFQFFFNILYFYSKKNKTVLTTHKIEIQDDSLFEETKYNRSYFYWSGIDKVVMRPGFIAVYVTPHSAVIIPKRAFQSKDEYSAFFKKCQSMLEKCRIN